MEIKRVFLIVLDSFGVGALPDAGAFGDEGSNTLKSVSASPAFHAPNLERLGLFRIGGTDCEREGTMPIGLYGKAAERSMGKDTVTGHWELAGVISERAMPVYPDGFPPSLLERIERETGIGTLCNRPYSGTEVIRDYGREQAQTGRMIVYTSADSVYQAAAHENVIPTERLYDYCRAARRILQGEHAVGRVIARPFRGEYPDYERTAGRHDFALEPPAPTLLDLLSEAGLQTIAIGKISDIFAGRGIGEKIPTASNADGMQKTAETAERDFKGLCFVNLVDFDSAYGHRNDPDGYAKAISAFDRWLGGFLDSMREEDLLILTADHGCDPATASTDHSREYIPILAYRRGILPGDIGIRQSYADVGKTIAAVFGIENSLPGRAFLPESEQDCRRRLAALAAEARKKAYAPYSGFRVGAALLGKDGSVTLGCNVESAAFSPTCCAERTALVKAISEGKREFTRIAVVGGRGEEPNAVCPPCGVCRQFLFELCGGALEVILSDGRGEPAVHRLDELLPLGFGEDSLG